MVNRIEPIKLRFLTQFSSFRVYPFVLFHPELNSFNPSIALHDSEIYFSLRHSNMLAAGNMRHYRTFNKVITWNASSPIDESSFGTLKIPRGGGSLECALLESRLPRFEDLRIFRHRGRWFALATELTGDIVRGESRNVMHLLAFSDKFQLEAGAALPSPTGSMAEKNWAPLCRDDALYVVYRPVPLDIYSVDFASGRMSPVVIGKKPAIDLSLSSGGPWAGLSDILWSGSSQFVPFHDETYIGVVHRKFVCADELIYEHAFLKVDKAFGTELSKPFHVLSFGIEMCTGLVVRGDDVLMSFGSHNDTRAYVCTFERSAVDQLFSSASDF